MNHPFLSKDFYIPWSQLTPDRIKDDITVALNESKANIENICHLSPDELTYQNTFAALEKSTETLYRGWGRLTHLDSVNDNAPQREAFAEMMPAVVEFSSTIALNPKLWAIIKQAEKAVEQENLTPIQKRFVSETILDFKESGADLSPEQKERITAINNELALATKDYREKVLDSTNAWELIITDEKELSGLPTSAKEAALNDAIAKGKATSEAPAWRFTQQFPSVSPVMQFAENDDLRKKVWEGACSIGSGDYDTSKLITQILNLRDEKAKILGFKNHADYILSRRMAGNGNTALQFIEDLHDKVKAPYIKEMETLRAYKASKTGKEITALNPWEVSYWSERQRKELYDFDAEELRPYFSVAKVMEGMFSLVSTLYDISVTERPTCYREPGSDTPLPQDKVEVWHPEVRFFDVTDNKTHEHLGSFYADWHPRESKRGGAWMDQLVVGCPPLNGQPRQPHLGLMCGNMTKPIGDKPALLTHYEVETIFHEFGHLLHLMLSDVPLKSFAGTNVSWDFVELPSQIMENWCWARESINRFAKHVETEATIPNDMFDKMMAARNYHSAMAFMRQLSFGKLDLELHIHLDKYKNRPIEEIDEEILQDYRVKLAVKAPSMARHFTHIFGDAVGYSAGYYSYKWAEVLDADAFTRFEKEGLLSPKVGQDFRRCILSQGNSRPAAELYRDFMGREPDQTALLKRSGIIA